MEIRSDEKTSTLTTVQKDNYVISNCDLSGQFNMAYFGMDTNDKKYTYRKFKPHLYFLLIVLDAKLSINGFDY
jgi:hypothetical protein